VAVDEDVRRLHALARQTRRMPADAPAEQWRQLYFDVRWTVRGLALGNPLLDFDAILFLSPCKKPNCASCASNGPRS
jgi:hypothetical protein